MGFHLGEKRGGWGARKGRASGFRLLLGRKGGGLVFLHPARGRVGWGLGETNRQGGWNEEDKKNKGGGGGGGGVPF